MSNYSKEGFRVIGFATKVLENLNYKEVMRIERADCEKQLTFLGLLVMENKLKKETNVVIQELNEAKIRTIMATGDNVLTAISVARQCSILNQENEVFLGELVLDPKNGLEKIEWTSSSPIREDFGAVENKRRSTVRSSFGFNNKFNDKMALLHTVEESNKAYPPLGNLPWNFKNTGVDVALTGKAFRFLEKNKDNDMFSFKSVLARA